MERPIIELEHLRPEAGDQFNSYGRRFGVWTMFEADSL